jgi:hypothetical protein
MRFRIYDGRFGYCRRLWKIFYAGFWSNGSDAGDQSSDYEEISVLAQKEGVVVVNSEKEDVISGPHLMKNLAWILVALGCGTVLSHYFGTINIGR